MGIVSRTKPVTKQVSDLTLGDAAAAKKGAPAAPAIIARPAGFDPAKAFVKDLTGKLNNRCVGC
jgi:hypothetical protein